MTPTGAVKVVVADDHALVLAGIRRVLNASPGVEIVGEARSGEEALALVERTRPHLALLDMRMPGCDGLTCLERIRRRYPSVKVVMLSANTRRDDIDGALQRGASAYIVKSVDPTDIAAVIRQVVYGTVHFAAVPREDDQTGAEEQVLTGRERTILETAAEGLSTTAISRHHGITEKTVKFHLTNIYRKLEVTNRTGALRCAYEQGLIATA
jgi:DNA-binding NarL/FixJ family response regulator